jgi:hypothetical protein
MRLLEKLDQRVGDNRANTLNAVEIAIGFGSSPAPAAIIAARKASTVP